MEDLLDRLVEQQERRSLQERKQLGGQWTAFSDEKLSKLLRLGL